jgi:hypothetical protein
MICKHYRRIRHGPESHPSSDHWTCAICGTLVPIHGARRAWIDSYRVTPPTCSEKHQQQAIDMMLGGATFHLEGHT